LVGKRLHLADTPEFDSYGFFFSTGSWFCLVGLWWKHAQTSWFRGCGC